MVFREVKNKKCELSFVLTSDKDLPKNVKHRVPIKMEGEHEGVKFIIHKEFELRKNKYYTTDYMCLSEVSTGMVLRRAKEPMFEFEPRAINFIYGKLGLIKKAVRKVKNKSVINLVILGVV